MPVRINIDPAEIQKKVQQRCERGLGMLSNEILNDCNQYCKRDQDHLIESSMLHSEPDKGKLVWQTPYARRQYYEIQNALTAKNPKATWKWCEYAKADHADEWTRKAQRIIGMIGGKA